MSILLINAIKFANEWELNGQNSVSGRSMHVILGMADSLYCLADFIRELEFGELVAPAIHSTTVERNQLQKSQLLLKASLILNQRQRIIRIH